MQRLAAMLAFLSSWKQHGCFQMYNMAMSTFRARKMHLSDTNLLHRILFFLCLQTQADLRYFLIRNTPYGPFVLYDFGLSETEGDDHERNVVVGRKRWF